MSQNEATLKRERVPAPTATPLCRHSREGGNPAPIKAGAPTLYRHSCVGEPNRARQRLRRGYAPSPLITRRRVIPAKAGTYPLCPLSAKAAIPRDNRPLRERPLHALR